MGEVNKRWKQICDDRRLFLANKKKSASTNVANGDIQWFTNSDVEICCGCDANIQTSPSDDGEVSIITCLECRKRYSMSLKVELLPE